MEFTYQSYEYMAELLKEQQFVFTNYLQYKNYEKCVILRHDVDYDLEKAVEFAQFETGIGVKSTYMVLISSDFYNIHSKKSYDSLKRILDLGHDLGLHFDETVYDDVNTQENIKNVIRKELMILRSRMQMEKINVISMHRPSRIVLDMDFQFEEETIVNAYGREFTDHIKYVSDSRMRWREPILEYIAEQKYEKYQILTHPFWYSDRPEMPGVKIHRFIDRAYQDRIDIMKLNFSNLEEFISDSKIERLK